MLDDVTPTRLSWHATDADTTAQHDSLSRHHPKYKIKEQRIGEWGDKIHAHERVTKLLKLLVLCHNNFQAVGCWGQVGCCCEWGRKGSESVDDMTIILSTPFTHVCYLAHRIDCVVVAVCQLAHQRDQTHQLHTAYRKAAWARADLCWGFKMKTRRGHE